MKKETAILVLAAGSSQRLGMPKQLLAYKETTLLAHTITQLLSLKEGPVFVVLGAYFQKIKASISHFPVTILENTSWEKGLASSIHLGVSHIETETSFSKVLITLSDLPLFDAIHYQNLLHTHQKGKKLGITITKYLDNKGVPVVFSDHYFSSLQELSGDEGAKSVVQKNKSDVAYYEANIAYFDVDTVASYQKLLSL
jgi:molybdenum cofactor cytidylyltransferase